MQSRIESVEDGIRVVIISDDNYKHDVRLITAIAYYYTTRIQSSLSVTKGLIEDGEAWPAFRKHLHDRLKDDVVGGVEAMKAYDAELELPGGGLK